MQSAFLQCIRLFCREWSKSFATNKSSNELIPSFLAHEISTSKTQFSQRFLLLKIIHLRLLITQPLMPSTSPVMPASMPCSSTLPQLHPLTSPQLHAWKGLLSPTHEATSLFSLKSLLQTVSFLLPTRIESKIQLKHCN